MDAALQAYKAFHCDGQTCCQSECLHILGKQSILIFFRLQTEEAFTGAAHYAGFDAFLLKQLLSVAQGANF